MLLKLLVAVGAENLLNIFLYRSPALKSARARLQEKVLRVDLKGFPTPLVLASSECQVDVLEARGGETDRTVITYVSVLSESRNRRQLITLIRSSELKVQGDIQIVQSSVALADLVELDSAGLLVLYTGNTVAEGASKVLRGGAKFLCHNF